MNAQQRLLKALDQALGFPNKVGSRINKIKQGFDQQKNEHVFLVEYRCRVNRGGKPTKTQPLTDNQEENLLRTLLNMVEWTGDN